LLSSAGDLRIVRVALDGGSDVRIREGSDANLESRTSNLAGILTESSSITVTSITGTLSGSVRLVRNGAAVYSRTNTQSVWSLAADISGAGGAAGLAARSHGPGFYILFSAPTPSGSRRLVEQAWPTADATNASPLATVLADDAVVPFGMSPDGCKAFGTRQVGGGAAELVLLSR
jgi:hypothetical protein